MSNLTIELNGMDAIAAKYLRLGNFQKLLRIPLNAALGEAKPVFQSQVGSRKASRAMKVRVYRESTGVVGKVGPVAGRVNRPGFLAALFLEQGTGIFSPRDKRPVSAQKSADNSRPWKGQVMRLPMSQAVVNLRFPILGSGRRKVPSIFTKTGKIKSVAIRNYGNAGLGLVNSAGGVTTFVSHTKGAPAKPWFSRASRMATPRIKARFAAEIHKLITTP